MATKRQQEARRGEKPPEDVVRIKVGDLSVDPAYQRLVDQSRVNRMAKKFDPNGLSVIEVAERRTGKRVLLDGQHRVETIRTLIEAGELPEDFEVNARIHKGMSPAEEASLFAVLQEQKPLTPLQKFQAMLTSNNEDFVTMAKILKRYKLKVAVGPKPGHVQAADAVVSIYQQYGAEGLDEVLSTLTDAWGTDAAAFQSQLLRGMAYFLNHAGVFDRDRLVRQLTKILPSQLLALSRRFSGTMSANLKVKDVAEGIRGQYNRGLRRDNLKVGPMQTAA